MALGDSLIRYTHVDWMQRSLIKPPYTLSESSMPQSYSVYLSTSVTSFHFDGHVSGAGLRQASRAGIALDPDFAELRHFPFRRGGTPA